MIQNVGQTSSPNRCYSEAEPTLCNRVVTFYGKEQQSLLSYIHCWDLDHEYSISRHGYSADSCFSCAVYQVSAHYSLLFDVHYLSENYTKTIQVNVLANFIFE